MTGRAEAMILSNVWKRSRGSDTVRPTPKRPTSATASAEFWRAFLRQDPKPGSPASSTKHVMGLDRTSGSNRSERTDTRDDVASSVEPADIARELGLSRFASVRALQRLRREFALKNHPDRQPSRLRAHATKRMMIANALIDSALKRFQFGTGTTKTAQPFESGKGV